jgi:MFS family permease
VVARVLSALFASAGEGLTASVVADLFFVHEHGRWMGLYVFILQSGTTVGTIATGFIITSRGWRWGFWVTFY